MILKIWKDPVWSKVIAAGIISLISFGYIAIQSFLQDISLRQASEQILNLKIRIIYVIIALILFITFKTFFYNRESSYSKKKKILIKYNSEEHFEKMLLYKWDIVFTLDEKPQISGLTIFCKKHGIVPLKFIEGKCPINDCSHAQNIEDYNKTYNRIESQVLHQWDLINNSR